MNRFHRIITADVRDRGNLKDAPAQEVVLVDVLVKQLKLDLLTGQLCQNDLNQKRHVKYT